MEEGKKVHTENKIKTLFTSLSNAAAVIIFFNLFLSVPTFAFIDWLTDSDFRPFTNDAINIKINLLIFVIFTIIFYEKKIDFGKK